MPKSMTGFSRVEVESGEGRCHGEARSLNSRYLEISLKLPRSASGYESRLREMAKKQIRRGRLDVTIKWEKGEANPAVPKANEEAIRWYVGLAQHLRESYGLKGDLTVTDVLNLKDILVFEEETAPEALFVSCFEALLRKLGEEREREGDLIKQDLLGRVAVIEGHVAFIEGRWPEAIRNHEERLRQKLVEISGAMVDEGRILQEMGFYMERLDIAEEIARLRGHVQNFRDTLLAPEEVGRKLDFIIQEMVRETNTIASKSNDLPIGERAIQVKVEIEKMREQVQNVE
jgi:uncharacterized protein (TIGR00255 family)